MNKEKNLTLQKRDSNNSKKRFTSSAIAVGIGFFTAISIILCIAPDPLGSLVGFFLGPFSGPYYVGAMLNTMTLLCFAATGLVVSQKSGNINLGGEGQVYVSGFLTALFLPLFTFDSSLFSLVLVALIVCTITGLLGFFSGILKIYKNANEILTTFLFSAAVIPIVDYGVSVFKDQSKNLLAMPLIPLNAQLPSLLLPSRLNISMIFAIILIIAITFFLYNTRSGYAFRLSGIAPEFAYFSGFSPNKTTVIALFVSAFCHGLTGFFAVVGTYYTCYVGFYSGLGWNALTASLIARAHPLAVLPACLLMAYLLTAAQYASLTNILEIEVVEIVSAVMLLCVTAQFILKKRGSQ